MQKLLKILTEHIVLFELIAVILLLLFSFGLLFRPIFVFQILRYSLVVFNFCFAIWIVFNRIRHIGKKRDEYT